jgi:hypothetical protein
MWMKIESVANHFLLREWDSSTKKSRLWITRAGYEIIFAVQIRTTATPVK